MKRDRTWADVRRLPDDPRPPAAMVAGIVLTLSLSWVGIGHLLGLPSSWLTGGVLLTTAVASVWLTIPEALLVAGLGFLVVDGFVQGSYGTLEWTQAIDLALVAAFVLLGVLVVEAAYEAHWSRPPARSAPVPAPPEPWWLDDDLAEASLAMADDELPGHAPPAPADGTGTATDEGAAARTDRDPTSTSTARTNAS